MSERVAVALQRKRCLHFAEEILDSRGESTYTGLTFTNCPGKTAWDLSFESGVNLNIHMPFHPYQTTACCFDMSNILNVVQIKRKRHCHTAY